MLNNIKTHEGTYVGASGKFAMVVGTFNGFVVESLLEGAVDALLKQGIKAEDIEIFRVPGAFEIPLAVKRIAAKGQFDAIVALGAVIRGGTPHFEYVAGECTKGLSALALEYSMPIAFGVLTVDSIEQAIERSGTKMGNKGGEAALSALEMLQMFKNAGI